MRLDLKRKHLMIGPIDEQGHSWALQDGMIFGWSESNLGFERAWWLREDGTLNTDVPNKSLLEALRQTRPFDPKWLTEGLSTDKYY